MKILNCDICGTSFPDTEEKCPTCGYSRAFVEEMQDYTDTHAPHEKVRGGRYSKKNVNKRLKQLENQTEAEAMKDRSAADAVEALVAEMEDKVRTPQEEPVREVTEETAVPAEEVSEEAVQAENTPEQSEPESELVQEPEAPAEEDEKAARAAYRRGVGLNVLLFTTIVVFVLSLAYVGMQYYKPGFLPDVTQMEWHQKVVAMIPALNDAEEVTEAPTEDVTEAPAEAPTAPPTEAPTDAFTEMPAEMFTEDPTEMVTEVPGWDPTEVSTEAATEATTEAPTQPQIVPLTLNYSELTFERVNQAAQMYCRGYSATDITWTSDNPNVVAVYDNGKIVAVGSGITYVRATYEGQSVKCLIKCNF